MELISICTQSDITRAAQSLQKGQLVVFPTETVYGLGADAANEKAISRIYSVKGRPVGHPLIVHISSASNLNKWAINIPDYAFILAKEFWPGPMTLILPRTRLAKNCITGGQDTIGLRVPSNEVALELLARFEEIGGNGVAAPSANRFGAVSPTTAGAVIEELGGFLDLNDLVMNGGQSLIGIESTIIDCTGDSPIVLRPGSISNLQIQEVTKKIIVTKNSIMPTIKVSGNLKSHYSPKAIVKIGNNPKKGDGFIALSKIPTPNGAIRLSSPTSPEEFARELYKSLSLADKMNIKKVFILIPKEHALTEALMDRISKASNKK